MKCDAGARKFNVYKASSVGNPFAYLRYVVELYCIAYITIAFNCMEYMLADVNK